jgi:TonB-linked SusC/RagA family outer membrane protein
MKRITSILVFLAFIGLSVFAQDIQITGKVTNAEDGSPLPGVSVGVKDTPNGTITNVDGQYTITAPANAILLFSFIGMEAQEIPVDGQKILNVDLASDVIAVEEVVVTAFGQTRAQKSLGYAATSVKSEEFAKQSQTDAMNALQGKVAGVTVTSAGGGPNASTKVIIRGYSSIKGQNNPLYVIDGTPIDNSQRTNSDVTGVDYGTRSNDVNPNDIESMSILKGAAATALYGPRASNGVIMITTKKGKNSEKIAVEFNTSVSVSDVLRLPQMQNTFGQGWSGLFAYEENGSWGPKLTGEDRVWGNVVDDAQKLKAFSPVEDNLYEFYDYGMQYNNSISLRGGTEKSSFYLSYNNSSADGVLPTNVDQNNKNAFTFTGSTKGKFLTASTSIHYVKRDGSTVADGLGGTASAANVFSELLQMPRDISIVDLMDYQNDPFNTPDNFFTPYASNPYFALNENQAKFDEDRIYGNVSLDAKITKWLSATYRVGLDASSFNRREYEALVRFTPGSWQNLRGVTENPGMLIDENRSNREFSQDILLNMSHNFDKISLEGLLGFNSYQNDYQRVTGQINSLVIPGFYDLSNTDATKVAETAERHKRQYGYFGTATIGYNEWIYLNLSGRQDYSSTLPKDANSFFYPAASLAVDLSEILGQSWIDRSKLRLSWGKAGNDADPYLLYPVMTSSEVVIPFSSLIFPLAGVGAFERANRIGNPNLKPEVTSELEFGIDWVALNSRISIDAAVYNRTSDGQILDVSIPASSGYSLQVINFGKVQNRGFELLASVVPVKLNDFSWTLTANYTKNTSKVLDLPGEDNVNEIVLRTIYDVELVAIEGQPLGVLRAPDYQYDDDGHIIVSGATGIPVGSVEKTPVGDVQPDYILGVINSFNLKDFSLSFTIDYRPGGYMYSGTADLHYFVGNATQTTFNERQPFIVPNSVKPNPYYDEEDPESPEYVENDVAINMNNINAYYYHTANTVSHRDRIIPRDFLKLREVTLAYKLPEKLIAPLKYVGDVNIILSGRNLLMWTPVENNFIDPESTSFGNDLVSELGEFRTGPTVRSFSASLRVNF